MGKSRYTESRSRGAQAGASRDAGGGDLPGDGRGRGNVISVEEEVCRSRDFGAETLADGGRLRVLTGIDTDTRTRVALKAVTSFRGGDVAKILASAGRTRGRLPRRIQVDNGTEFTSKGLDAWTYWKRAELVFSRPGKPDDNAHAESFNVLVRRGCLSQHWFKDVEDARGIWQRSKEEYNNERPRSSLGPETPARYRSGQTQDANRIEARR